MRVLYEGAIFEVLRTGGIARYFSELIDRLPTSVEPSMLAPSDVTLSIDHPRFSAQPVRTRPPLRALRRVWRPTRHALIERQAEEMQPDLVHWTYYIGLCRRPVRHRGVPNLITVHDFIHEAFPDLDPSGASTHWKREAIRAADHIFCVSETTRRELCERYPETRSRCSTTLLAGSLDTVAAKPIDPELQQRPFVLYVGRRNSYKNFRTLWQAWQRVRSTVPDLALVSVGPPMKPRECRQLGIRDNDLPFFHFPDISDSLLKGFYESCEALVISSKKEGFGLPAVEAMQCGAPVIASTCPALQEVIGSAGYFFEPDDVDALADHLKAVGLQSLPGRGLSIARGHKRAAELTWQETAKRTVNIYDALTNPSTYRRAA